MKKEILIFGASGALGKGVAQFFFNKDYDKIHLFDSGTNTSSKPQNVIHHLIGDLTVEKNVESAFESILPDKHKLYFLFTTVGGFFGGKKLWETEIDEWEKMIQLNLRTSFLIAKHFAKIVKDSAGGSICFTSAFTAVSPEENKAAYGASKGGLIHLVKTLAKEGVEIRLSANAIAPYIIDTPANRGWMKKADFDKWIKPEEIGELVNCLFNNYHFISGNTITLKERLKLK